MRKPIWRKAERVEIVRAFTEVITSFKYPRPDWSSGPVVYDTKLGPLHCDFSVSETLLHVYLQFRGVIPNEKDLPAWWPGELNKFSSKWNFWLTPNMKENRTEAALSAAELLRKTLQELEVEPV